MATELYIDVNKLADLLKAEGSNYGTITSSSEQRKREYDSSYSSRPEGVAAGEGADDSEDAKEEKSITETIEDARKIAKSLRGYLPTPLEQQFMVDELGFPEDKVSKGLVTIPIRHRASFQNWLGDRLSNSLDTLKKAL
jgi:hypothetical protein